MYYKLKSGYILRGWDKLPWLLIERPWNQAETLSQDMFQVLLFCDGETEEIPDALQPVLCQCIEKGWVEPCENPQPLDQDQYYRYYHNAMKKGWYCV